MQYIEDNWTTEGERELPGAWTGWTAFKAIPADQDDDRRPNVPPPASAGIQRPEKSQACEDTEPIGETKVSN